MGGQPYQQIVKERCTSLYLSSAIAVFSPTVQSWGYLFLLLQRGNECRFIELFGRGKDNKLKTKPKSKVKLYLWHSPCMAFQGSDPRKRPRRTSPVRFLHRAKASAGDFSVPAFVYQILSQTPCSFNWVPFFCNWKSSPVLAFLCSIYWKTNKNKNRALRSCIFFNFRRPCGREGKLQLCYRTEQSELLMYLVSFIYTPPSVPGSLPGLGAPDDTLTECQGVFFLELELDFVGVFNWQRKMGN